MYSYIYIQYFFAFVYCIIKSSQKGFRLIEYKGIKKFSVGMYRKMGKVLIYTAVDKVFVKNYVDDNRRLWCNTVI